MGTTPNIAILAGGASRRMGRDKASLIRDGATLLARTVAIAAEVVGAERVVVIGRERPMTLFDAQITFLPDERPGDGPLAAIGVALRWTADIGGDRVAVLPCDLPLLTVEAVRWLVEFDGAEAFDGVAVCNATGRIEPLFSVYHLNCRVPLVTQIETGRRSPTALIENGNFRRVDAPEFVRKALVDVDTPKDWEAVGGGGDKLTVLSGK